MAGCELVFHVAALVRTCRRDPSAMVRVNVEGTRNVVAAAARAGVRRLVLTSSAATIGERAGEVGNEDTPHRGWYLTAYERTKHEAEEVALELGTSLGVEVVVVNPASVQGGLRGRAPAGRRAGPPRPQVPAVRSQPLYP
jgi:dihydroflavonol-4-reductase